MSTSKEQAQENGRIILSKMRDVRQDALRRLDAFSLTIEQLRTLLDSAEDPRYVTTATFANRMREAVEALSHIHTGSTDYQHVNEFLTMVIQSAAGDDVTGF